MGQNDKNTLDEGGSRRYNGRSFADRAGMREERGSPPAADAESEHECSTAGKTGW